jgi:hypothetical protein
MELGGMDITGMNLGGRSSDRTAYVARRWVDAWTRGDVKELESMLAADATIECNLGWPARLDALLETVRRLSVALDGTMILSLTATDDRAAVLSDCRVAEPPGGIRVAEFLDVTGETITGLRRVFDLTAVAQLVPNLHA